MEWEKRRRIEQIFTAALVLLVMIWLSSFGAFWSGCQELKEDVLRLHILAQSDSEEDQRLKLLVRDRILAESAAWVPQSGSKEEMMAYLSGHLDQVEAAAEEVLAAEGCNLPVRAELSKSFFDTRVYGERTMPAGWYDALQVVIGQGEGHNWWCVLYPPLCLPAAEGEAVLDAALTEEEKDVLSSPPRYQVRFLTVELLERLQNWIAGQPEG